MTQSNELILEELIRLRQAVEDLQAELSNHECSPCTLPHYPVRYIYPNTYYPTYPTYPTITYGSDVVTSGSVTVKGGSHFLHNQSQQKLFEDFHG